MKKTIILLISLGFIIIGVAGAQEDSAGPLTPLQVFEQQRGEIQILNLVNSLFLTQDQMQFILEKAKMARIIEKLYEYRTAEIFSVLNPALLKLSNTLAAGQEIPDDLKEQVNKPKHELEVIKTNYEKKRLEFATEVKDYLDGNQLYVLDTYKPCLILPQGPGRIGQVENTEYAEKMLANIRTLPQTKYDRAKGKVALKIIEQARKKLPVGYIIDGDKEKARIIIFFDEARKMNDVDFNLHQAELVQAFKSDFVIPKLPVDIAVKIDKFLLNENIIPILQQRLKTN